jgi:O-antigen ligase
MFSGKGIGKKIGYIFIGVCILSLGWIIVPEENKGRIRTIWAPEEGPANAQESAEGRIAGYNAGVVMFKSRPFTGVGIGNFSAYRVPNIDGIPLQAHNLEGQLLGEMGSLGVCAFLLMIGATLVNCRITARLSKFQNDIKMMLLGDLARACMVSLILLVFLGTFAHNLFRYNWLWLAAFSVLALQFQKDMLKRKEVVDVYN